MCMYDVYNAIKSMFHMDVVLANSVLKVLRLKLSLIHI